MPTCFSANAYNEYKNANDKTQTEWNNALVTLFGSSNCSEYSAYVNCGAVAGSVRWDSNSSATGASCHWDDDTSLVSCRVFVSGSVGCDVQ